MWKPGGILVERHWKSYSFEVPKYTFVDKMLKCYSALFAMYMGLASFPGSCVGEEERDLGTHCLRMRKVPLVTAYYSAILKLRSISVYLLKGRTA